MLGREAGVDTVIMVGEGVWGRYRRRVVCYVTVVAVCSLCLLLLCPALHTLVYTYVQVLGPIPVGMSSRADKGAAKFFTSSGSGSGSGSAAAQQPRLAWPDSHTTNKSKAAVK